MKNLATWPFLALLTLLVFVLSCEKPIVDGPSTVDSTPESLLNQAKSTFNTEVNSNAGQARLAGSKSNGFTVTKWQPQWHQALTFLYQGAPVVEVPVLYDGAEVSYRMKSTNNSYKTATPNGVTKLVFFKHKDGSMASYMMELILSDNYLNTKKNSYKRLSLEHITEDFSGVLNFTDYSHKSFANYRLEAGKVVARSKGAMPSSQGGRLRACDLIDNCQTIETSIHIGCCTDGEYNYNPTGTCCENNPKPHTRYDTYCNTQLLCYPDPPTEPNPGNPGSPSDPGLSEQPVEPNDVNNDISCTSFVFTQTSSNWQEAGVKGFYFIISYRDGTGRATQRYDITGQIVIGLPITRANGDFIPAKAASELAAKVVDMASDLTFDSYKNLQGNPSAQEVERTFRTHLQTAAKAYGAHASTNGSGNSHILIKQSEFSFWGTGNCDN